MPAPAFSLRLRKIRNRFGITAPRVVVRSHIPWFWKMLAVLLVGGVIVLLAWAWFQRDQVGEFGRELHELHSLVLSQREELEALRSTAGTRQNAVSIERAAQDSLLVRIRELEQENAALKEDMLLFERLIPVVGDEEVLRLEGFRVTSQQVGRYRYRLLLAYQPSRQKPEFSGRLQLVVAYQINGRAEQLVLPATAATNPDYLLTLRRFLRREGGFQLPAGARLHSVEARIFQGATLLTKQSVQP